MQFEISKSCILIVDDIPENIKVLGTVLRTEGFQISFAQNGKQAIEMAERILPDLILLDIMMPELDGIATCKELKQSLKTKEIPVVFITAKTEQDGVVEGFKAGAIDYINKPFNSQELLSRVRTHLTIHKQKEILERELKVIQELFKEACYNTNGELLGESDEIKSVRQAISEQAPNRSPLILIGSPGSGEEAIARSIHKLSSRYKGAFIYVNCALLKKESEEINEFKEKFDLAVGGTLYLERIDDLPRKEQEFLLEMLNNPDNQVRIICYNPYRFSSNCVNELNHILNKNILRIPTLLERREDISFLAKHYTQQLAQKSAKKIKSLSENSLQKLNCYFWPGNIRELRNVIERAMVFATNDSLELEIEEELLQPGIRIDRYRLIEKIGEGGMGEVWLAKHQALARPAAIKLIKKEELESIGYQTQIKRFQLEAQTIADLQSPHTVTLYDYGVTETGTIYYVMELLKGMDLSVMIKNCGPMPPERVAMLLAQACRSLTEAHQAGVIHRDIKPQNLFIATLGTEYDFLKVLDFGTVKKMKTKEEADLTGEKILGTPLFIAPESISGNKVADRSDIYSLGCTAYWMLTGQYVFTGINALGVFMKHLSDPPPLPSEKSIYHLPKAFEELIMHCLEKKPENRPTAYELWQELNKITFDVFWTHERAKKWWKDNF